MAKGGDFEWVVAKALSKWLTHGQDNTQLVRSVLSGGSSRLKTSAARPEYQVGDLSPNGPQGETFRRRYGVECKAYHTQPDWWGTFHNHGAWPVQMWWDKLRAECAPYKLEPLLVMKRDRQPIVVGILERIPVTPMYTGVPSLFISELGMLVIQFKDLLASPPEDWLMG